MILDNAHWYWAGGAAAVAYVLFGFQESKRYWRWEAEDTGEGWAFAAIAAPFLWPVFRAVEAFVKVSYIASYPWRRLAEDAAFNKKLKDAEASIDRGLRYETLSVTSEWNDYVALHEKYKRKPTKTAEEFGIEKRADGWYKVRVSPGLVPPIPPVPPPGTIIPLTHIDVRKKLSSMTSGEWYHLQDCDTCLRARHPGEYTEYK